LEAIKMVFNMEVEKQPIVKQYNEMRYYAMKRHGGILNAL
jgi:hypothetical protein